MYIKKQFSILLLSLTLAISPFLGTVAVHAQEAPATSPTTEQSVDTQTAESTLPQNPENQPSQGDFSIAANAAYAIDGETGKVFYDQNGETPMGIASITKIITTYLVYDQIKNGKLSWDEEITVPQEVIDLSVAPELSNVELRSGQKYTIRDLVDATMIQSGNAAAMALAIRIAGSESSFVDMMKTQLNRWGIKDAYVVNASGVNNSFLGEHIYPGSSPDDENLLSAKDVALVAYHLIKDYPEVLEISKTVEKTFGANAKDPIEMVNWNWMLPGLADYKEGVDGLKTGTTDLAGACFVGSIVKDNRRVITVVLNAHDAEDASARFKETSKLMDYCYDNWHLQEIVAAGSPVPNLETIPVDEGKKDTVAVQFKDPVNLWVKNDAASTKVEYKIDLGNNVPKDGIKAPVRKAETIGHATVAVIGDELGYISTDLAPKHDIITSDTVDKASTWNITLKKIQKFFGNLF